MSGATVAAHLDGLGTADAWATLDRCCGARRWVDAMLAARPFGDDAMLYAAAERTWWSLAPADWLEAFARHPRIGERVRADDLARREQGGMDRASAGTREALAQGNRAYEGRFGHVFLIRATGRTPEEMLSELQRRLGNDSATELRVAAMEQAKITRLRLEKLGGRAT